MSSANNKKLKKTGMKYVNGIWVSDCMLYLYIAVIFGVYPWIMDNKYFNITITRYRFFMIATCIYILLAIVGYMTDALITKYYGVKLKFMEDTGTKSYLKPEFWMGALLISQLFAWLVAADKSASMTGEYGRRMGFAFFIVVALMFMIVSTRAKIDEIMVVIFAATSSFAYIVAIFQHMDIDFMKYKDRISPKVYDIFISTFGNINIFSSFLCMSIPVFLCVAVFSKRLVMRLISLLVLCLGGMCVITANSDSAYLGIGAAVFLILLIAYKKSLLKRYVLALISLASGNLFTVILNHTVIKEYDKRGGVSELIDNIKVAAFILVVLIFVYIVLAVCSACFGDKIEGLNKNKIIMAFISTVFVCGIIAVIVGVRSGADLFTFNYKWGTYRGYIWTKCAELFDAAPLKNKIFGYGNESLRSLMKAYYNEEMIKVTGKTYDNAHNEVLQYLITTGIVGALSYLGLVISTFVYILKRASGNTFAYACLAAITGYFMQSLINVNQPITTPLYFVFMALGVGCVRYKNSIGEEK